MSELTGSTLSSDQRTEQLQIACFGPFRAGLNGRPITDFRSVKGRALLAYLAIERDHPHRRETLAGLLWPDTLDAKARRNLSQTLLELRQAIHDRQNEPPFLIITPQTIALNPHSDHRVDVVAFSQHLAVGQNHTHPHWTACPDCIAQLQQAVELYQGQLLDGFSVPASDLFETWLRAKREQLQQQVIAVLTGLSNYFAQKTAYESAQQYTRRCLELAPWQEEAHRQLIGLLAQSGQRSQALVQFETCRQILAEELGVEPAAETVALFEQIRAQTLPKETGRPPRETASPVESTPPVPYQAVSVPAHFVGREKEIEQLKVALTQPGAKIQALIGMSGLGKTTLAAQVACQLRPAFSDGVLWANTATGAASDILLAWSRAYGYDFSSISDLESRAAAVRGLLADKQVLIVLDNVATAGQIRPLLPGGEGCAILLTSRDVEVAHALNAKTMALKELPPHNGRQLLTHILGQERVTAEAEAAAEICRLVSHLPLAVEIAAQRLKSRPRQTLANMAARLQESQRRLGLEISDLAVRASFDVSWTALDKNLQAIFPLLAVFAGRPFTAEAIVAIAEIDLFDAEDYLYDLVSLSLLQEEGRTQFRQHPLLADFAAEKLTETEIAFGRMTIYYAIFVRENREDYAALEPEWDNIAAALETAHRQERWQLLLDYTEALTQPWFKLARYSDARQAYRWADEAANLLANQPARANNWLRWSEACIEQNDYETAQTLLNQAQQAYYVLDHQTGIANSQSLLARIAFEQNDYHTARSLLSSSQTIRAQLGDMAGVAEVLTDLARIHLESQEAEEAWLLADQALPLQEAAGDEPNMITTLLVLASSAVLKQDFATALTHCQRAQQLAATLHDQDEMLTVLYTLTVIQRYQTDFEQAKVQAEKGLALARRRGQNRIEGQILYQLSVIHKELADYTTGLIAARQSLTIFQQLDYPVMQAFTLLNLGDIYAHLGERGQSLTAWQQSQEIGQRYELVLLLEQLDLRLAKN